MHYPMPLRSGDTIGLIAPCSPMKQERLPKCMKAISNLGFRVILGKSCTQSYHGYLAGPDVIRANDIHQMFANPKVKAIICLRGGYGSTRIMDMIDYNFIKKHPKIFVGYSDVTSFHLAFQTLSHLVTFHGPMVSSNMVDDFDVYTKESFLCALSMPKTLVLRNPEDRPFKTIVGGVSTGQIVGGCLSLVAPSIGTFYQPDFQGKILFLEDVDESLPRCDKLMQQLIHSNILNQINGIILGTFKGCINQYDETFTMYDYFKELFRHYKKPVIYGVQCGHEKPNATIPLGSICTIDTSKNSILFEYT